MSLVYFHFLTWMLESSKLHVGLAYISLDNISLKDTSNVFLTALRLLNLVFENDTSFVFNFSFLDFHWGSWVYGLIILKIAYFSIREFVFFTAVCEWSFCIKCGIYCLWGLLPASLFLLILLDVKKFKIFVCSNISFVLRNHIIWWFCLVYGFVFTI